MGQVYLIKNVPLEDLVEFINDLKSDGATEVTYELQNDGKFTVKATFPNGE